MAQKGGGGQAVANAPGTESVADAADDFAFWHFGLLPADGQVSLFVPGRDARTEEERFYSAYDLWNGKYDGINVFAAKFRQGNALVVRGWHFHATTQARTTRGPQQVDSVDYPGQVAWVSREQVRQIVAACYKTFIRWTGKPTDPRTKFVIGETDYGKKPAALSEEQWQRMLADRAVDSWPNRFNARTDKVAAEFVYAVRLEYDRARLDEAEYAKNPNRFHAQMVGGFSREWFEAPPKSVAEMYPREERG